MQELLGGADDIGWVALKTVLLFVIAVLGLRLSERRTLAQLNVFDLVVAVAIGAVIGRTDTSDTASLLTGVVVLASLLLTHRVVSVVRRRGWLGSLLDHPPVLLVMHGEICRDALARTGLTVEDLHRLLRQQQHLDASRIAFCLFEEQGTLTLVEEGAPLTASMRAGLREAGLRESDLG